MKKIITLLLLAVTFAACAEKSGDHMTFMDIPIDGTLKHFCKALEKKNFEKYQIDSNAALYQGLFTGSPAYIIVYATPNSHLVFSVRVVYKSKDDFDELNQIYYEVKEKLTNKYGAPVKVEEIGERPQFDIYLDMKLDKKEIVRLTNFETERGYVNVGMDNISVISYSSRPCVFVGYADKENVKKYQQEIDSDL